MRIDHTARARQILEADPVAAADFLITSVAAADLVSPNDALPILAEAAMRSGRVEERLWKADPVAALFDPKTAKAHRFVGVCLARLLAARAAWFEDATFRLKAINLLDEVFEKDVYVAAGLTKKSQTFQKETALEAMVAEVEADLTAAPELIQSLQDVTAYRQRLMQMLKSPACRAFVSPFVPRKVMEVQINDALGRLCDYVRAEGADSLSSFHQAQASVDRLCDEASASRTHYADLIARIGRRLSELLLADFADDPRSKPAQLEVFLVDKKYPLYESGQEIHVRFKIENSGSGKATDVRLSVADSTDNLRIDHQHTPVGAVAESKTVHIPFTVVRDEEVAMVRLQVEWTNFDRSTQMRNFEFELQGQRRDIDWNQLENEEPYGLEPATTESELIGRTDILERLVAKARAGSVGSFCIYGQKRVGKTSIAKAFASRLKRLESEYVVVYLDGGDYVHPNSGDTISKLGELLCEEIRYADPRLRHIEPPRFDDALAPLADFLRIVQREIPGLRVVMILDEFDELPLEMYKPGPVGDAFFLTLRSISGKSPYGFVLVGGENMELVLNWQGDSLNKFQTERVDYFDRAQDWDDFVDLVRSPLRAWFEFTPRSFDALYAQSAGNPFFTKLVCAEMFRLMVERRDNHVTEDEVSAAVTQVLATTAGNSFHHFWKDGILDTGDRVEQISMNRRKVLLALAQVLRRQGAAPRGAVVDEAVAAGMSEFVVEDELREFERRQVVLSDGGVSRCKVPLFQAWLRDKGVHEIVTTFADPEAIRRSRLAEEELYVSAGEILRVTDKWGLYRGRRVTEEHVRAWLEQFEDLAHQRLMFRVLEKLLFMSDDRVRQRLRDAHGIVRRGLTVSLDEKRKKRSDILVSYLDRVGKSGAAYAKLYADENLIYADSVVEKNRLGAVLKTRHDVKALVFLDDFVGTGDSASKYFVELVDSGVPLNVGSIPMYFIAVAGFQRGLERLEKTLRDLNVPVEVHVCEPLGEENRCFSAASEVFRDEAERERAREVAYAYGSRIVRKNPLGFGDLQAAIVFADTIPNNCLPVLWGSSSDWHPLFERT